MGAAFGPGIPRDVNELAYKNPAKSRHLLDRLPPISVRRARRFPVRGSKGNAVRGFGPEAAAAPATVSGEPRITMPLGNREGDATAATREPGDLPSSWSRTDTLGGVHR